MKIPQIPVSNSLEHAAVDALISDLKPSFEVFISLQFNENYRILTQKSCSRKIQYLAVVSDCVIDEILLFGCGRNKINSKWLFVFLPFFVYIQLQ